MIASQTLLRLDCAEVTAVRFGIGGVTFSFALFQDAPNNTLDQASLPVVS